MFERIFRKAVSAGAAIGATVVGSAALAQGYEPVVESFRFDASDQLIIDRGGPVDRAGDVNGDNLEDLLVGAGVGAIRVVYGPTRGNNGVLNGQQLDGVSGFVIANDTENDSVFGGIGDINSDGLDDIGAASLTGTRVIFGATSRPSRNLDVADLDGSNGFRFSSAATDIKRAGDVNGDGIADFVVGNANASPNGLLGAGVSYVIFGRAAGQAFDAELEPSSLNGVNGFAIVGISAQDRTGRYVSGAGDFNNDGFDDLLIGAPNQTVDGKAEAGAAYLILGGNNFPAVISLADINGQNGLVFNGSDTQHFAGAAVAAIGDLNHDGIADIAIGAPSKGPFGIPSDFPGEAYVLFGGQFGGVNTVTPSQLDGSNGFVLRGIRGGVIPIEENEAIWGDMAGSDIDTAGDINGDGIDDMIIGAPHTIINSRRKGVGQAYFVYGSTSAFPAQLNLAQLDGSNGFRINGEGTVDYYAVSVASAADFNDDDRDDVIIGASGQGESYVFYGRETGAADFGPAPRVPAGAPSQGFIASALSLGADAVPLAFNERRDPTGPNPLPPGTPTDPLNPETPGFTAPNPPNTAPPARPGDEVVPPEQTPDNEEGQPDGTGEGGEVTEQPGSSDTEGVDGQPASPGGSQTDGQGTVGGVVTTGGGIALWISLVAFGAVLTRRFVKAAA